MFELYWDLFKKTLNSNNRVEINDKGDLEIIFSYNHDKNLSISESISGWNVLLH